MNGFVLVEQVDAAEREQEVTNGEAIVSDTDHEENDETNESNNREEEEPDGEEEQDDDE